MIEIATLKGEIYKFDEETERIFKDGKVLESTQVEPIYTDTDDPSFAGILLKDINSILSLSGKINPITDPNII